MLCSLQLGILWGSVFWRRNRRLCVAMWFCLTDGMDLLCAEVSPSVSRVMSSHRPLATVTSNVKRHNVIWDNLEKSVSDLWYIFPQPFVGYGHKQGGILEKAFQRVSRQTILDVIIVDHCSEMWLLSFIFCVPTSYATPCSFTKLAVHSWMQFSYS